MDNIKQTGKRLRKTERESDHNVRRIAENLPLPERTVTSFNKVHPYRKTFAMDGQSAYLNLKIKELTTPCTVNPPAVDVRATMNFAFDNPGVIINFSSTSNIIWDEPPDPPRTDFILEDQKVYVPVDGCYSVFWESGAWGAGYFFDKHVIVGLQHNGYEFRTVSQATTGGISVLGPTVFVYTPASPIYGVFEAKAGDYFTAFLTQEDISQGYPWIGQPTGLHGFFYNPAHVPITAITLELIALAEG